MIPKIIHFVYGLQADFGGKPFGFAHWAAIKTAQRMNKDYRVIFWCKFIPENYFFDDLKDSIEIQVIDVPTEIFGRKLNHVAHQADIVRLNVLNQFGGFYLDIDTITVKSFDALLNNKFLMAKETLNGHFVGLCNAIMAAQANSEFGNIWLQSYTTFRSLGRDEFWSEHSVKIPSLLAEKLPDLITVLPDTAFFYPDYSASGLESMFINTQSFPDAYAFHLWESLSWGALNHFNESNVHLIHNTYTHFLNNLIKNDIDILHTKRKNWCDNQFISKTAKINLGCGSKHDLDFVNFDLFQESGADIIYNIQDNNWPIPSDSVQYVRMHHVLEHIDGDLHYLFKELYRVCADGAVVDIRIPHPRHDWFLIDPTHTRALLPESFSFFDRDQCLQWFFSGNSKTPLALYWDIDFKVEKIDVSSENNMVLDNLSAVFGPNYHLPQVAPFINNLIAEIHVTMRVSKKHKTQR